MLLDPCDFCRAADLAARHGLNQQREPFRADGRHPFHGFSLRGGRICLRPCNKFRGTLPQRRQVDHHRDRGDFRDRPLPLARHFGGNVSPARGRPSPEQIGLCRMLIGQLFGDRKLDEIKLLWPDR
jgi:hypothetical protein